MGVTNDSISEWFGDVVASPPGSSTSIDIPEDPNIEWIMSLTAADANNATDPTPISSAPKIPRVPGSIGPYHFGNNNTMLFEKRKPDFAMKLFSNDNAAVKRLYEKLAEPEMVKDLRSYYDQEHSYRMWKDIRSCWFSDSKFTKMILLDGCFIFYFICSIYRGWIDDHSEFKSNEIFFIRRDLYLLENQIPFKVLKEVMMMKPTHMVKHIEPCRFFKTSSLLKFVKPFIDMSSFVVRNPPKRKWFYKFKIISRSTNEESSEFQREEKEPDHLLGALHGEHARMVKVPTQSYKFDKCNFRSVNELVDVGIHFKPIIDTLSMTYIEFVKGWWGFSANVKLPPIAVSDYSRPMLLNMMAYETCKCSVDHSWVKSYVLLLGMLIDDADDVKVLRKSWVLHNLLASDQEVVKLFDEIAIDLVENDFEYLEVKYKIQRHLESWTNTLFSQLKNEYVKSPWAFLALLGAVIALVLTGVQTYYTVWRP